MEEADAVADVEETEEEVDSLEEFFSMGEAGLYIGHPDGYFYKNTTTGDSSRTGITKTKPAQTCPPVESAAKYYFARVEGTEDQVYAYCYDADGTTKKYLYNGGNNSLSFTTEEADRTAFTVIQSGSGTFRFHNGVWYWNMQGGASGARFCACNSANDGNNSVNLWYKDEAGADPYELEGLSYGLMNWTGGVAVMTTVPGLLSSALGENGYPDAAGGSLAALYADAKEVNHLFIESTYRGTGYYEFDSAENFATLKGASSGDFTVYKELGSYDSGGNKNTLKHGQFFPFNDLQPGVFASVNGKNLYSATAKLLADSDPRKYEQLYSVEYGSQKADCHFGLELEASFSQTPSGKDTWGHDIIFEFTGDDDFWLYVDGELVIDLGGIHSAMPGSVNFRTGDVYVNGTHTTLKDLFYKNYLGRRHSAPEAQAYVDGIFVKNEKGQEVFADNSGHTMRIFYMERGAGASNLHMRFNLAAVKRGTVQVTKKLSGVDETESVMASSPTRSGTGRARRPARRNTCCRMPSPTARRRTRTMFFTKIPPARSGTSPRS